jgi:hypothetical protein
MQVRTLSVRTCYVFVGLVPLTSWGCHFLLYSLRKPQPNRRPPEWPLPILPSGHHCAQVGHARQSSQGWIGFSPQGPTGSTLEYSLRSIVALARTCYTV